MGHHREVLALPSSTSLFCPRYISVLFLVKLPYDKDYTFWIADLQ